MKSKTCLPAKYSVAASERTACETLRVIKPAKAMALNPPIIAFIANMADSAGPIFAGDRCSRALLWQLRKQPAETRSGFANAEALVNLPCSIVNIIAILRWPLGAEILRAYPP